MAKIEIDIKGGKVKKDTDVIIGIDLGTTNSLVAYVKDEEVHLVKDVNDKNTLVPSVVHFSTDGNVLVGDKAKKKIIESPGRSIFSVKRLMGKSFKDLKDFGKLLSYQIIDSNEEELVKIKIDDKYYTPIELSAEILKELKQRVETELGETVQKAVITVPAYFNDTQRQATRDAGKLAGLDVLRVVNEPTAASLAYGLGIDKKESEYIAVYDLGGGTFDISILLIEDGVFEVLSTNGDTFLGGDDFDMRIYDHWKKSIDFELNDKEIQTLRIASEKAKKHLSTNESYTTSINFEDRDLDLSISLADYNTLITPLIEKTIDSCKQAIIDSNIDITDIDHVIMVGGSTRVPLVNKMVSDYFGKSVNNKLNPDEVVAQGAAIQADILAGNRKDMLLLDITPLSLGIETVGGLMDVIIPRNSKIPTKVGRKYTTSIDGQKNLKIAVYQGERDLVENNRKLGEFILSDIPPMAAGIPQIEIHFLIDADGILVVRAKELRSNVETRIQIKSQYGISEEEMARMLIDSIQQAKSDMKKRSWIELKNEADNLLHSSLKFIEQNEHWLNESDIKQIDHLKNDLKDSLDLEDVDLTRGKMDKLNVYTTPLAHKALDVHIAESLKGKSLD